MVVFSTCDITMPNSSALIYAHQYADDATFPILTADRHQRCLDVISETYLRTGLVVKTTKAKVLSASSFDALTVSVSEKQHTNSENFVYLDPNVTFVVDLTYGIQRHISPASSVFGRLKERVFTNRNLSIHKAIVVYNAALISTMLNGCDSWVPFRRHIRLLESFCIRRLWLILRFRWWNKVTPSEIRSRSRVPSIESMLFHRQLRWLRHVIRM